jgi:hypothetical protein
MKYLKKINLIYQKYILQIANNKYPNIKERKYSLKYYLSNFELVLSKLVQWDPIRLIVTIYYKI